MIFFKRIFSILLISGLIADPVGRCLAASHPTRLAPVTTISPAFSEQALTLAVITSRIPTFRSVPHKVLSILDSLFPSWRNPLDPLWETIGNEGRKRFDVQWPEEKNPSKRASWF